MKKSKTQTEGFSKFVLCPCVSFCTGHFVMVPLNMTYLCNCLLHSLFEHLFNLYWVTIHLFLTELWAFFKVMAHLAGASVSYGHISSFFPY